MKIWHTYGSEHSMNLVMIGQFKDAGGAKAAKKVIERLTAQVGAEVSSGRMEIGKHNERYSREMLDLLYDLNIMTIGAAEMQQFAYEVNTKMEGNQVVVTTDESDISAFLKVMIDKGARVEVFSAHDFPDEEHGRGR